MSVATVRWQAALISQALGAEGDVRAPWEAREEFDEALAAPPVVDRSTQLRQYLGVA